MTRDHARVHSDSTGDFKRTINSRVLTKVGRVWCRNECCSREVIGSALLSVRVVSRDVEVNNGLTPGVQKEMCRLVKE